MSVSIGVTVVHKTAIARVGAEHASRVLNWAPVLFSARRDLPNVAEYPLAYAQYAQLIFSMRFRYASCSRSNADNRRRRTRGIPYTGKHTV